MGMGMGSLNGAQMSVPKTRDDDGEPKNISGSGGLPVTVRGSKAEPWKTFKECNFPRDLLDPLLSAGFPAPSPVQQYAWPIVRKGDDCIAIAKTGSGKTLAFLIPAFARILEDRLRGSPSVLVMAPTRELATQIVAEGEKFGRSARIRTVAVYGGQPKGEQLRQLRDGPACVVGTPGRLNDFLEMQSLSLRDVEFLILDEADRMLDMGFEPQIRKIIMHVPRSRQTMMFSATWPKGVQKLAMEFLNHPAEIRIGNTDALQANTDIIQEVVMCDGIMMKQNALALLLRQNQCQAIVFVGTKRMADQLCNGLSREFKADAIHGDRNQQQRDRTLQMFKEGRVQVLVATDVAARGLDVKAVKLVVNFDPPQQAEDYVHRIGRTGRAGTKGLAVSLLTMEDGWAAKNIEECMRKTGLPVPAALQKVRLFEV
jgi:ATP-dependent RNA helicase DDX5/DBP2